MDYLPFDPHDFPPIRDTTHLTSAASGYTVTSLRRSSSSRGLLRVSSKHTLPVLTEPTRSCQDLGLAVAPTIRQLQKWANVSPLGALAAPPLPPPRAVETEATQRTVNLKHPLFSRADELLHAPMVPRPHTAADQSVLRHLRVGTVGVPLPHSNDRIYVSALDRPFSRGRLDDYRTRFHTTYGHDYMRPKHGHTPTARLGRTVSDTRLREMKHLA